MPLWRNIDAPNRAQRSGINVIEKSAAYQHHGGSNSERRRRQQSSRSLKAA